MAISSRRAKAPYNDKEMVIAMEKGDGKRHILLVDDDVDFVFQLKAQLEAAGYGIAVAHTAKAAMERLAERQPDLCILDLMMEKPDVGFTLCYRIKKKDASILVIMVTSVTSETNIDFDASTKEERSWIKADALLDKPVRFEQLQREIARLLKG